MDELLFSHSGCPTICDPMGCSTPGSPILHHLPELAQTHVHWVGDAIQKSHPLSSPSPALNLSQHQGLFYWVGRHNRWPKYWNFSFSINPSNVYSGFISLELTGLISFLSKELSSVTSSTTVQKYQFFGAQPSLRSNSYILNDYWKTHSLTRCTFVSKEMSLNFKCWLGLSGGEKDDKGLDDITDSMDMNLSKLQEMIKDREPGMLQSMGSHRARQNWVTEQQGL